MKLVFKSKHHRNTVSCTLENFQVFIKTNYLILEPYFQRGVHKNQEKTIHVKNKFQSRIIFSFSHKTQMLDAYT